MARDDQEHRVRSLEGYTLLTGATGLLGRYLLRDLLVRGHEVAVLARTSKGDSARARVETLLQGWESQGHPPLPRPVVLTGDVAADDLGLHADTRRWIGDHCGRLVHGAAVVRFHAHSRRGEPWRTNVEGARRVFALCRDLAIDDLHYISTAYVCGDRQGTIHEAEFHAGQGFRNDYEKSKHLAETALRAEGRIAHRTVYRPGVIAGDARTGYTSTYHGLYVYLRALSILLPRIRPDAQGVRRIPYAARLPLEEKRNIVPVDWTSRVIVRLLETPEARGLTYHLTPAEPVTPRHLLDCAGTWYGNGRVELCAPNRWNRGIQHLSRAVRMLSSYEAYGSSEPTFDTSHLRRFAGDLVCPRLEEAVIHRYLAYAERDGWGRRR